MYEATIEQKLSWLDAMTNSTTKKALPKLGQSRPPFLDHADWKAKLAVRAQTLVTVCH